MNIFVLPSWYPSPADLVSGIFIKEQVEAIASCATNVCQCVSTWGHQSGHLSLRSPTQTIKSVLWRLSTHGTSVLHHGSNVTEFFSPTLSWSRELPFGGAKSILSANSKNLSAAIDMFGKIDLIHAHVGYPGGVIASILSKGFHIPYVLTEHMGPLRLPSLLKGGLPIAVTREAFNHASTVIAVSPFLAERLRELNLGSPIVIPNLVNEDIFFPGEPCKDKFIFFSLCLLGNNKGIDVLLHSIADWCPPVKDVEFWIGGDGPMASSYKALATQLNISDRITWIGAVDRQEAARLFRQCHVFVLPSGYETFGVVYAEAIASGKPIIATRCGGPESIVNDINGTLVDVGDPAGLSQAMQTMASKWFSYSQSAIRNDFIERFSRKAVVVKLVKVYQSVLSNI